MKLGIRSKSLSIFIFSILTIMGIFAYFTYTILKEKQNYRAEKELLSIGIEVQKIIFEYQFKKDNIDYQKYLNIVEKLSLLAKRKNLISIKSFIKKGNNFYLIATSATDRELLAKSYQKILTPLDRKIKFNNKSIIYKKGELILKLGNNLILIKSNKSYFNFLSPTVIKIFLISFATFLFFIILLFLFFNNIRKRVNLIHNRLEKFFNHSKKEIKEDKGDEITSLSLMIDRNFEKIEEEKRKREEELKRDEKLLKEIIEKLTLCSRGNFKNRITSTTNNQNLKELKEIVDRLFINMDSILSDFILTLKAFNKNNYTLSIKEREYQSQILEIIKNINLLSDNISSSIVERGNYMIKAYKSIKNIEDVISNNLISSTNLLKIIDEMDKYKKSNSDLSTHLLNSIKRLEEENRYLNSLLNNFGKEYRESLEFVADLFQQKIANTEELKYRFISIVQNTYIRDKASQEKLIAKMENILFSKDIKMIAKERIFDILRLLEEELLKDMRYSLHLFEENIQRMKKENVEIDSSSNDLKLLNRIKEKIIEEKKEMESVENSIFSIMNLINEIKYNINNQNFKGKEMLMSSSLYWKE